MKKNSTTTKTKRNKSSGSRTKHHGPASGGNDEDTNTSTPLRFAVLGLGYIAQAAVLPAFAHTKKRCELTALVSGDDEKLSSLGKRHGVKQLFSYDEYEECLKSGAIDAVYIALPNTLHCDATIRAAEAGIHVLCEKPMATTTDECREMIAACRYHDVALMIAYRLHFEEANLAVKKLVDEGTIGDLRYFSSNFSMQVANENIRLDDDLGGGPLFDIGIYCINGARMLFGEEPRAVIGTLASPPDGRFQEVEGTAAAVLHFSRGRIASFTASFAAADTASYEVVGTKGTIRLEHAYEWHGNMKLTTTVGGKTKQRSFKMRDQFAPELLAFAEHVRAGTRPEPSGEEGLADIRVINALYLSAGRGELVELPSWERSSRPELSAAPRLPAPSKPKLVNAHAPSE